MSKINIDISNVISIDTGNVPSLSREELVLKILAAAIVQDKNLWPAYEQCLVCGDIQDDGNVQCAKMSIGALLPELKRLDKMYHPPQSLKARFLAELQHLQDDERIVVIIYPNKDAGTHFQCASIKKPIEI